MGNQNCSQIYQDKQQNQSYGDFTIIKENNRNLALIEKTLQKDQTLIAQVKEKLQLRLTLRSNHLVKLQKYDIVSNKFSINVKMFYEFIQKTLEDRLNDKIKENCEFSERELFNIIYGVQDALLQLKKHEIVHGCINLTTILCQNNFYKITDVSSTTFVKSYELVRRGCRNQFLSPKLLTNLEYRSLEPYYQIDDDFFSLGMVILTLTCGVQRNNFYSWKQKKCTGEIRWQNVQNSIRKIERIYSSKLSKKIKQLIGFGGGEQLDKSNQTNSTTANNNVTKNQNLGEITQSFNYLDKDIERILSRVNISTSVPNPVLLSQIKSEQTFVQKQSSKLVGFNQLQTQIYVKHEQV